MQSTVQAPANGWSDVIAEASLGGIDQLYQFFYAGLICFYAKRGYSQDAADLAMNAIMGTARSIRRGEIKDPSRLPAYVRSVAVRCLSAAIEVSMRSRARECAVSGELVSNGRTPEDLAIQRQRAMIVASVMRAIPCREREVLTRFYLDGQSKEEICEQMQMTEDQFRNVKSRAKIRITSMIQSATTRQTKLAA